MQVFFNYNPSVMRLFLFLLTFFSINKAIGQVANEYAAIDKKMAVMPDSLSNSTQKIANYINSKFTKDSEKLRAAFFWTANSIAYDVPNMFEPNFLDSPQEKILKTLKSKKGVCIHYAEVFNDIVNKTGITCYVINLCIF